MTTVETLIQQLTHAMTVTTDRATLERLAAEYAAQCRIANRRLEQCLSVVQHGNPSAAVQLAEAPPALLDLVAQLSFDRSEQWRQFCRAQQLPEPEPANERALGRLNEVYSKAAAPTHPLYREYRQAMADRDEMRALKALRSLAEKEPQDAAVQAEVKRLELKLAPKLAAIQKEQDADKQFQSLLAELRWMLDHNELTGADNELKEQHDALTRQWQRLQEVGRPVPLEVGQSLARRQQALRAEFTRRRRTRTVLLAVAIAVTVAFVTLALGFYLWPKLFPPSPSSPRRETRKPVAAKTNRVIRVIAPKPAPPPLPAPEPPLVETNTLPETSSPLP